MNIDKSAEKESAMSNPVKKSIDEIVAECVAKRKDKFERTNPILHDMELWLSELHSTMWEPLANVENMPSITNGVKFHSYSHLNDMRDLYCGLLSYIRDTDTLDDKVLNGFQVSAKLIYESAGEWREIFIKKCDELSKTYSTLEDDLYDLLLSKDLTYDERKDTKQWRAELDLTNADDTEKLNEIRKNIENFRKANLV